MPRATANSARTERVDLESCPGGYVVLRRQTYGEKQRRADIVVSLTVQAADRQSNGAHLSPESMESMSMEINNLAVSLFDFKTCIIDHNLDDEVGRRLDFSKPTDIESLDGPVGDEIEDSIRKLNRPNERGIEQFREPDRKISVLEPEVSGNSRS